MQKVQHEAEPSPPPPCYHASKLSSGCWVLSIVALSSISHLLKSCKHHRVHSTSSQPENIPCWALQTRNYCCYFSLFFFLAWICHCISKPSLQVLSPSLTRFLSGQLSAKSLHDAPAVRFLFLSLSFHQGKKNLLVNQQRTPSPLSRYAQ